MEMLANTQNTQSLYKQTHVNTIINIYSLQTQFHQTFLILLSREKKNLCLLIYSKYGMQKSGNVGDNGDCDEPSG